MNLSEGNRVEVTNAVVADLYWLLFSPVPILSTCSDSDEAILFPSEIIDCWREESVGYFLDLDKNPQKLEQFVERKKNKRLGFYAESLLSYFFQTFPQVELLLQNFQVLENKRTQGEIDFIIRWRKRIIHLECAVKYYLYNGEKESCDTSNWVGPSGNDNLARKLNKALDFQLPLVKHATITEIIGTAQIESYLFLRGKFYAEKEQSCAWLKEDYLGEIVRLNEVNISPESEVEVLIKPFWMSDLNNKKIGNERALKVDFETVTQSLNRRAALINLPGREPFFLVSKEWPFKKK